MEIKQKIVPCLWFDDQAEEAIEFYLSIFDDSRILEVVRYGEAGKEITGGTPGEVMTVSFELNGQPFTALNGGPIFQFSEAISLQVFCETQQEVDDYWEKLSAGGDESAQACGWLKDRYGLSWQIIPRKLLDLIADPESQKSQRTTEAMLQMKKLDIGVLKKVYAGS
jgi:predicted 3-demethylubiquinone-9 3-methyltransferase (glyoxalase superfamily)